MGRLRSGSLNRPDESRNLPRMQGGFVRVGPLTIGRARLEPGWRWSIDVKPLVGSEWCEIHHLQLVLEGRLGIALADGESGEYGPGEICEIPPGHDAWVAGNEPVELIDVFGSSAEFGLAVSAERVLATLLMTDIVGSTPLAARVGDAAWRQLLGNHNRIVRSELERFRGREVNTTGDGFLATFASPGAALRCALAIRVAVRAAGLEVRIGVHTGEIELLPDDIGGLAVHATARIMAIGGASEILVSATTRSLADGLGLRFEDRGAQALKGLETPMAVAALLG